MSTFFSRFSVAVASARLLTSVMYITPSLMLSKILVFTARCYAERGYEIACCLSVCLSVTFRYRDHIGWNTSKIISRSSSLRPMLSLTWAIWCDGNTPKIRVE